MSFRAFASAAARGVAQCSTRISASSGVFGCLSQQTGFARHGSSIATASRAAIMAYATPSMSVLASSLAASAQQSLRSSSPKISYPPQVANQGSDISVSNGSITAAGSSSIEVEESDDCEDSGISGVRKKKKRLIQFMRKVPPDKTTDFKRGVDQYQPQASVQTGLKSFVSVSGSIKYQMPAVPKDYCLLSFSSRYTQSAHPLDQSAVKTSDSTQVISHDEAVDSKASSSQGPAVYILPQ